MYACPACGRDSVADTAACECGADLSMLRVLEAIAEQWFNRALQALAEGRPGSALEWLSACCAARPTDAAARRALAKVWAQLNRWDEAGQALDRAAAIDPDSLELVEIREALQDARAPRSRKSAKPPKRSSRRNRQSARSK